MLLLHWYNLESALMFEKSIILISWYLLTVTGYLEQLITDHITQVSCNFTTKNWIRDSILASG